MINSTNERPKAIQTEDANNSLTSFGAIIGIATFSAVGFVESTPIPLFSRLYNSNLTSQILS